MQYPIAKRTFSDVIYSLSFLFFQEMLRAQKLLYNVSDQCSSQKLVTEKYDS